MVKDPYSLLGVPRGAPEAEIRKAYRTLVRENHPDANPDDPGAEERFKEIQEAYEVLSDPTKRREHDQQARSSGTGAGARRTVRAESLADLFNKVGGLSYERTGERREFGRELRREDLARFATLLGMPLDRITRLLGEHAKAGGNVSFGGGRPEASSARSTDPGWEKERPPVPEKPPIPPKPPKTAKPDDFS